MLPAAATGEPDSRTPRRWPVAADPRAEPVEGGNQGWLTISLTREQSVRHLEMPSLRADRAPA